MSFYPPNYHPYDYATYPVYSTQYFPTPYDENFHPQMAYMHNPMMPGVGGKATETKPRLAKDEVDKLEREFQKNNKPNSSTKKQLAEEMRVDIARINNWFQNRRAKAKQERRTQENEARRKSEQDAETTTTSSDAVKEYYPSNDQDEDLRPSAAPFPPISASVRIPSAHESPSVEEVDTGVNELEENARSTTDGTDSEYTSPESTSYASQEPTMSYSLTPDNFFASQTCDFPSSLPTDITTQTPCLTISIPSQFNMPHIADSASASSLSSYQHLTGSTKMDGMSSHFMTNMPDSIQPDVKQEQLQSEDMNKFDQFSPESMANSPPEITTPDFRFKSPSTIDIASRRNSKRPAQLVSCVRSQSYNFSGPKTGIEMPRREAPSPMRRVASATGNFPRGIQKATSAGPRSPNFLDRNQENLLLLLAGQGQSPISRNSVAPPTPNTPVVPSQQEMREATVSSMSSEEDKNYGVQTNLTVPQYTMDPTLRTPPDTPGLMNAPGSLFSSYGFAIPDDSLHTPSFGGFDTEFRMATNVPTYVAHGCGSQPVTPSFPPNNMGPAFCASYYGGGNTEYNWSDVSSMSAQPSPEQSQSKQFQFTNMTPHDFNSNAVVVAMGMSRYKKGYDGPGGQSCPESLTRRREPDRRLSLKRALSTVLTMAFTAYLLATCLYLLPALSASVRLRSDAPVVNIKNGSYSGIHNAAYEQDFFLGVPYAQVPERFSTSEGLNATWEGTRPATEYPKHCVGYGGDMVGYESSEDCLYLNIVRPAGISSDAQLPVALWIHGGGLFMGGSADRRYNLSFIVENSVEQGTPVIGVSINYRLSVFGFPGSKEAIDAGAANLGFRDQRLALRWINENIGSFGGASDKVTIFGESSGAESVSAQVLAYNGRDDGLFRGAIAESGFGGVIPRWAGGLNNTEGYQANWDSLVANISSCASTVGTQESLDCLRSAPLEEINSVLNSTAGPTIAFFPVIDHDFIADYPTNQLNSGDFVKVPILIGCNTDEGSAFGQGRGPGGGPVNTDDDFRYAVRSFIPDNVQETTGQSADELVEEVLKLYPDDQAQGIPGLETWPHIIQPGEDIAIARGLQQRRTGAFFGDMTFQFTRRRANIAWSTHNVPSYAYRFDVTTTGTPQYIGATHFQEVAFVFYNLNGLGYDSNPFGGNDTVYTEKATALAKTISLSWVNFFAHLDPNGAPGLGSWPVYETASGSGSDVVFGINGTEVETDDWRKEGIDWLIEHGLTVIGD
ncbi:carboxylesterase [Colletotrichum karsti]|uniref:Carboxylesterase n=1 Tax=Colletotrichum karsti TaxID=1095194 RepID=A0A9P6LF73_9PEZI|nr:carboxylesterase [Colletotrichum karsti]KAF9870017.1 carboxylesterase [Colletotrichum karsti]